MAVIRQGGNPNSGLVETTRGLREKEPPICPKCHLPKAGQIYSRTPNGEFVCEDCASPRQQAVLRAPCDPDICACGGAKSEEPDPA